MSKSVTLVDVEFCTEETRQRVTDVVYKKLSLPEGSLPFWHLELKGNTYVLLNAMGGEEFDRLTFVRAAGLPTRIELRGEDNWVLKISRHTVISLSGKSFYYLDQLDDGTWRVAYTAGFFDFEHQEIKEIDIKSLYN